MKPVKKKSKYSRAFSKRDAKHYIIYSFLSKWKVDAPYLRADEILEELETRLK